MRSQKYLIRFKKVTVTLFEKTRAQSIPNMDGVSQKLHLTHHQMKNWGSFI